MGVVHSECQNHISVGRGGGEGRKNVLDLIPVSRKPSVRKRVKARNLAGTLEPLPQPPHAAWMSQSVQPVALNTATLSEAQ